MKKNLVTRKLSQLRPHPRQTAIFSELSAVALQDLADDMTANGLISPVEITSGNVIIAGHGRVNAAKLLGWPEIECWLRDDLTLEQAERRHVEDNLHRRQLTKLDKARAYQALLALDDGEVRNGAAGDLRDVIGSRLGVSGRTLDRLIRVLDTPIEIQQAFDAHQVTLQQAGRIASLPHSVQQKIARQLRAGQPAHKVVKKVLPAKPVELNVGRELGLLCKALEVAENNLQPHMHRVSYLHQVKLPALQRGSRLLAQLIQTIEKSTQSGEFKQPR